MLSGAASPFVIRLNDLAIVFQTRRQDIRVASFIGAFQAMLRTIDSNKQWSLESLTGTMPFHLWRRDLEISRIRFKVGRSASLPVASGLISLMVQCKSDMAALELRAKGGIDVDGELIRELLQHADAGYGELVAVGRKRGSTASERVWVSALEGESVVAEVSINADTGEAAFSALVAELEQIPMMG